MSWWLIHFIGGRNLTKSDLFKLIVKRKRFRKSQVKSSGVKCSFKKFTLLALFPFKCYFYCAYDENFRVFY